MLHVPLELKQIVGAAPKIITDIIFHLIKLVLALIIIMMMEMQHAKLAIILGIYDYFFNLLSLTCSGNESAHCDSCNSSNYRTLNSHICDCN